MGLSWALASARACGPQTRHWIGLSLWERRKGLLALSRLIVSVPRGARKDASRRPASVMFLGRGYLHRMMGIGKWPPNQHERWRHEGAYRDGHDPGGGARLHGPARCPAHAGKHDG